MAASTCETFVPLYQNAWCRISETHNSDTHVGTCNHTLFFSCKRNKLISTRTGPYTKQQY